MPLRLVTPPADEPVTTAEAKTHLRIEHALDDVYIDTLIQSAREYVEQVCWRGLVTQTWELLLDSFPGNGGAVELPMGNLQSITSVQYVDLAGDVQTSATSVYEADTATVPGLARLKYGQCWPDHREQWDAVRIQYVVGWAVADVPQSLKQALLLLVSQMYEHRTPEVLGTVVARVHFAFNALVAPHRLVVY